MSNETARKHQGVVLRLGVREMPWVIRAYFFLFLMFVLLMLIAVAVQIWAPQVPPFATDLATFSKDALQLVLGAVLGSLGLAADQKWKAAEAQKQASVQG